MSKIDKKPEIRFKEFTDPWEQRKLNSLCDLFTDGDWIEAKDQSNNGVRLIQTGNIGINEFIDKTDKAKWVSYSTYKNLKCKEVLPDDILISRLPEPAGRACVVPILNNKMITAVDCTIARVSIKYSNKFIVQYLSTRDYFDTVNNFLAGGTRQRISRSTLADFNIPIPKSLQEQEKIGEYFSTLDNLITLHQRKYNKLLNLKKSCLEKMFPKSGSKFPEIRFKGFFDPWEQRKLNSLCDLFTDGDWIEAKDQSNNGVRLIQTGNIGINEFIDKTDKAKWVSYSTYKNLKCKEVLPDDILISRLPEPAGRACVVPILNNKMITAVDCTIARVSIKYSNKFIVQYLSTRDYFDTVNNFLAGGTRQRISRSTLADFNIPIPKSLQEQEKIGEYFSTLDNLITLHQRKYNKLLNLKKSCLEKMFPKSGSKFPEIRFKGFFDPWEQRKLNSLCDLFTDGDWIEAKDQSNNGVRLIQTGNIGINEFIDKTDKAKWVSYSTYKNLKCKEVLPDDILISRLPEPAGRACVVPILNNKMITAVDCTIARVSIKYSNKFIVQYLSTRDYFDTVNNFLAGGTRQRISRSTLADFNIPIPKSLQEQEKIGEYFSTLDNLITLHQRKYNKLLNLKKSCLEKMFPKNGSKFPEIRFKGFFDPWKQRKLNSLCDLFTDGDWIEAKDQSNNGVRLIQTGNIGINEFIDNTDKAKWVSYSTYKNLKCKEVLPDDILISRLPEPAGRACVVPILNNKMIT